MSIATEVGEGDFVLFRFIRWIVKTHRVLGEGRARVGCFYSSLDRGCLSFVLSRRESRVRQSARRV